MTQKPGSPNLPTWQKNFLLDIDGFISEDISNDRPDLMITAQPIMKIVNWVNQMFKEGHIITFWTSRLKKEHGEITLNWLRENRVPFTDVIFGKPRGGNYCYVDDKSIKSIQCDGSFVPDFSEMEATVS